MIGSEWLFRKFCKDPRQDTSYDEEGWTVDTALSFLEQEVPNLRALISGKVVLDFGCGYGYQVVAFVKQLDAAKAVGVDIVPRYVNRAREIAKEQGVLQQVEFYCSSLPEDYKGFFDVVVSLNSFEHYSDPRGVLYSMLDYLKPGGRVIITFGPLWYSPYGGHGMFMTNLPWYHLIFKEETIMKVRSDYRSDGARRFEEVEGGLNKMSVRKFEAILSEALREADVIIEHLRYRTVKGLPVVARIPLVRELLINHATCILRKGSRG